MYRNSPVYINFNLLKLYREYRKASNIFIMPKFKSYRDDSSADSLLRFEIRPLQYKYKYGEPRHEFNPMIIFEFLYMFKLYIELGSPKDEVDDYLYWEGILWYNDTNDIVKSYEENLWHWTDSDGKKHYMSIKPALTHQGFIELYRTIGSSCYNPQELDENLILYI